MATLSPGSRPTVTPRPAESSSMHGEEVLYPVDGVRADVEEVERVVEGVEDAHGQSAWGEVRRIRRVDGAADQHALGLVDAGIREVHHAGDPSVFVQHRGPSSRRVQLYGAKVLRGGRRGLG